jgi:hypothetical protein
MEWKSEMTEAKYNALITKTFRDEAIRSVMMIDDDFVPYDELCKPGFTFDQLASEKKQGTEKAASLHRFFQEKKIICDVDKGNDHIHVEKIRKCDLIILDYHLEPENPTKSLCLLRDLSSTEHMNIVVVYTREDLEKVWISIASCLAGTDSTDELLTENPATCEYWNNTTDYSANIPEAWAENITSEDVANYLITGQPTAQTTGWFGTNLKAPGKLIARVMCSRRIAKLNSVNTKKSTENLIGEIGTIKWLQIGNVFIVLHNKTIVDNPEEPSMIWDSIEAALIRWSPCYYQLLISEMQNRLENEPISFAKDLANDKEGQAAWLNQVIDNRSDSERAHLTNQLFGRLTEEIQIRLFENEKLRDLMKSTFDSLTERFDTSNQSSLDFSASHVKAVARNSLKVDVGHALNYSLCTRDFDGKYITSGTVMYDQEDETKWYLCVAPACETVPLQATGLLAKRLKPHRLMKVLVLENVNIQHALNRATDSNFIFVKTAADKRKAFGVLNLETRQPVVDYALVKNHDSSSSNISKEGIKVCFLDLDEKSEVGTKERTLLPISQLRDMYTARFQAIASHHTGRIGVDYINFK